MNTFFALMAEYGTANIPVAKCSHVFGLSPDQADAYAARQKLPIPAFRAGSQKSPWMVDASKLAELLDARKQQAEDDWRRVANRGPAPA